MAEAGLLDVRIDTARINAVADACRELRAGTADRVFARVLNRVGDMAYTRVIRNLSQETGAAQKFIREQVARLRASGTVVPYRMHAQGGYIPLEAFHPRPTAHGISADPWGKRQVFKGSFIGPGGHVFVRKGKEHLPIRQMWGPAVPRELLRGGTERIINDVLSAEWGKRVQVETEFEINRVKSKYNV